MPRKPRVVHVPKKPQTLREWHDSAPQATVMRKELFIVLEGFELVPAPEIGIMIKNAVELERQTRWYRRLWRWVKATMWQKKTLGDLSPEERAKVQRELDRAAEPDSPPVVSAGVAKQIKEASDGAA